MPVTISPYAFVDLPTAKSMLSIPLTVTTDDAKLTLMINAASTWIEKYCDRQLVQRTSITEVKDGRRSNKILLHEWPVVSVTSLYIDQDHLFTDPTTLLDPSTYGITDDATSITTYEQLFPNGYDNVQVTYVAGFLQADLPSDLILAAAWVVEWYYRFNTRGDIGRTTKAKGDENTAILQAMPQMVIDVLLSYKRTEFPDLDSPARTY